MSKPCLRFLSFFFCFYVARALCRALVPVIVFSKSLKPRQIFSNISVPNVLLYYSPPLPSIRWLCHWSFTTASSYLIEMVLSSIHYFFRSFLLKLSSILTLCSAQLSLLNVININSRIMKVRFHNK